MFWSEGWVKVWGFVGGEGVLLLLLWGVVSREGMMGRGEGELGVRGVIGGGLGVVGFFK